MNENAKIFICTHTDFECPVKNPVYEIADSRKIFDTDRAENGIDGLFYSELMTYRYLAQHPEMLPNIVGFCGYRKYFSFMDNVPDLYDMIERHGCIATTPYKVFRNVYRHYGKCFCFADMDVMKAIVYGRHRWFYNSFNGMLESDHLYTCNMFIMHKTSFILMMNFVWSCLDDYLDIVGWNIRKRIIRNREFYLKQKGRGAQIEHQFRIGGNLGERLVSAYISHFFPNTKTYDIVFTEDAREHRPLL